MPKNLVIVESPTKAKTISRFLGKDYKVESSFGHVRDLPKSKMGIDIENNFAPQYVIPAKAKKRVAELKKLAAKSDTIYYATDSDREGEAIAWHLDHIFNHPQGTKRIAFHEITKKAIEESLKNPRTLDLHLVDAQQARRVLDRLVGYELSPFLWKKVAKGLSAGRVQSVTVRLIVDREKEIAAFKTQEYWTIEAEFNKTGNNFPAVLTATPEKKLEKFDITDAAAAQKIAEALKGQNFVVSQVEEKETERKPLPPFTTSTLQQQANQRLGFSAKQTMMLAQQLYEGVDLGDQGSVGLITYMRTDSVNLADKFLNEAQETLTRMFGREYVKTTTYQTKSKLAQEAHEAIRPTEAERAPENVRPYLEARQFRLYDLIWRRALASQMAPAKFKNTKADILSDNQYIFRASGSVIMFAGYLKLMPNGNGKEILPELNRHDKLNINKIEPIQHFTEPPPRYTEAALIKALEELGIGRPSTYAPTIATIQSRKYVEREEKKLKPTEIGTVVTNLLVEHFPKIVDYKFTARLEDNLDEIAQGEKDWTPIIKDFYQPFKKNLMKKEKEVSKKELTEEATDEVCQKCQSPMVIKLGRFGKFMACSNFPDCRNTKPINENGEIEAEEKVEEKCPKCGKPMVIKHGRFGKFLGCSGYPECKSIKNLEQSTGVQCPECGKGDIVAKKSRRGKTFYACNQYPDCKFALWSKPTGDKCPDCGSLLVFATKNSVNCSNKECKYKN
ncbi:TPA: type I DNA topoisomerase [Candidatus Komeilibacteria bacterium]|nr:MAG: topoisomerase protein [Parcubacteria group bacterium GW2011_GWF2_45_11]KKT98734.1 MAG: topoisomerase protein [Parcubacteria group bacterium GW2011_GWC2_45_15]OGY94081.1 MAG: DNA topoisomerase I [Candidatus Komeilibacteria bacterium RIFOXYC2_FULL_45_12]HAH04826.1 type I DNA topoisomerase [Candidatus Komeilibacteria bacterium]HBV02572.1 type I DNA topoisomerase [Candidatus Komeilibacteria bacterium]